MIGKTNISKVNKAGFAILMSGYIFPLSLPFFRAIPDPRILTSLIASTLLIAIGFFFVSDLIKLRRLKDMSPGYAEISGLFLSKLSQEPVLVYPMEYPYSWLVVHQSYDPSYSIRSPEKEERQVEIKRARSKVRLSSTLRNRLWSHRKRERERESPCLSILPTGESPLGFLLMNPVHSGRIYTAVSREGTAQAMAIRCPYPS